MYELCLVATNLSVQLFATPWTVACQALLSMEILQARIMEWVAMPSSRGSSQPRDQTQVTSIVGGFFTVWATREAWLCIVLCLWENSYIKWTYTVQTHVVWINFI